MNGSGLGHLPSVTMRLALGSVLEDRNDRRGTQHCPVLQEPLRDKGGGRGVQNRSRRQRKVNQEEGAGKTISLPRIKSP